MDVSVFDTVQTVVDGTFEGGTYVGTLDNDGVGLGAINPEVPAELVAETEALADQIIAGEIQSAPENAPYTY
jgi:basic membrane protein A